MDNNDQEKLKTANQRIDLDQKKTDFDKQRKTELMTKQRLDRMKQFRKKIQEMFEGK
jgi:hypothetical protein